MGRADELPGFPKLIDVRIFLLESEKHLFPSHQRTTLCHVDTRGAPRHQINLLSRLYAFTFVRIRQQKVHSCCDAPNSSLEDRSQVPRSWERSNLAVSCLAVLLKQAFEPGTGGQESYIRLLC